MLEQQFLSATQKANQKKKQKKKTENRTDETETKKQDKHSSPGETSRIHKKFTLPRANTYCTETGKECDRGSAGIPRHGRCALTTRMYDPRHVPPARVRGCGSVTTSRTPHERPRPLHPPAQRQRSQKSLTAPTYLRMPSAAAPPFALRDPFSSPSSHGAPGVHPHPGAVQSPAPITTPTAVIAPSSQTRRAKLNSLPLAPLFSVRQRR